jgi:hypothetical protein
MVVVVRQLEPAALHEILTLDAGRTVMPLDAIPVIAAAFQGGTQQA